MQSKYKEAVIDFINKFWQERCYSPSIREICIGCGMPSTSHVAFVIESLRKEGVLTVQRFTSRSIVPQWVVEKLRG